MDYRKTQLEGNFYLLTLQMEKLWYMIASGPGSQLPSPHSTAHVMLVLEEDT